MAVVVTELRGSVSHDTSGDRVSARRQFQLIDDAAAITKTSAETALNAFAGIDTFEGLVRVSTRLAQTAETDRRWIAEVVYAQAALFDFQEPNYFDDDYLEVETSHATIEYEIPIAIARKAYMPVEDGGDAVEFDDWRVIPFKTLRNVARLQVVLMVPSLSKNDMFVNIGAQTGKIHELTTGQEWVFEGAQSRHVKVGGWQITYNWVQYGAIPEIDPTEDDDGSPVTFGDDVTVLTTPALGVNQEYMVLEEEETAATGNIPATYSIKIVTKTPYEDGDPSGLPGTPI